MKHHLSCAKHAAPPCIRCALRLLESFETFPVGEPNCLLVSIFDLLDQLSPIMSILGVLSVVKPDHWVDEPVTFCVFGKHGHQFIITGRFECMQLIIVSSFEE